MRLGLDGRGWSDAGGLASQPPGVVSPRAVLALAIRLVEVRVLQQPQRVWGKLCGGSELLHVKRTWDGVGIIPQSNTIATPLRYLSFRPSFEHRLNNP